MVTGKIIQCPNDLNAWLQLLPVIFFFTLKKETQPGINQIYQVLIGNISVTISSAVEQKYISLAGPQARP